MNIRDEIALLTFVYKDNLRLLWKVYCIYNPGLVRCVSQLKYGYAQRYRRDTSFTAMYTLWETFCVYAIGVAYSFQNGDILGIASH